MKYLSLFSGIGGFECGIKNSKYKNELECIGFSEVDKYATSIYRRHFPKHKELGDVTKINTEQLEDFDLLVGGFPCQSFSNSGYKRGFDDTRGTLFFEIARILRDKRPKYFLLENVQGLLWNKNGKTFQRILKILTKMGYSIQWKVLNSKNYGVPQSRPRVYIKGYIRERESGEKVLFNPKEDTKFTSQMNIEGNLSKSSHISGRVFSINGCSSQLTASNYKHPLHIQTSTKKGYKEAYDGDGILIERAGHKIRRGMVQKESTGTLNCSNNWGVVELNTIRRLTPLECERLQGFPDNWTQYGVNNEKISDTQRYKCCGNAVTTNVITHIFNNWDLKD